MFSVTINCLIYYKRACFDVNDDEDTRHSRDDLEPLQARIMSCRQHIQEVVDTDNDSRYPD